MKWILLVGAITTAVWGCDKPEPHGFYITQIWLHLINTHNEDVEIIVFDIHGEGKLAKRLSPGDSLLEIPWAPFDGLPRPFGNSYGDSLMIVTASHDCKMYYRDRRSGEYGSGEGPFGLVNYEEYDETRRPEDQDKIMTYIIDSSALATGHECRR